ncbi:MAG: HAD family hydrolase [Sedimentitalea sp.]
MTQAVIFDFGNVIIHWQPEVAVAQMFDSAQAARDGLKAVGFFEWNAQHLDGGTPIHEALAMVGEDVRPLFATYVDNIGLAHAKHVAGVSELIERLHGHLRLFGMTNASELAAASVARNAPCLGLLEDTFISGRERLSKPSPEAFECLLTRNNLAARACVFVDDSAVNVDGARAVGIDAIHFIDAGQLEQDLIKRKLL